MSGGLDSIVLLHALVAVAGSIGVKIAVAHFNHGLRGRESDADELFVRRLTKKWQLPLHVGRMACLKEKGGESIEMKARRERHKFLAEKALEIGVECVFLGHHADDQLETIFMRLFRGEGSSLGGIREIATSPLDVSVKLIRPLLRLRRADLEDYAKRNSLKFREDSTNQDEVHLRNRIRRKLIPLVKKQFGEPALNGILRSAEIVAAESDWVDAHAREWLAGSTNQSFSVLPVVVQRRVIRAQLLGREVEATFPRIEWLRNHEGQGLSIGREMTVVRSPDGLIRVNSRLHTLAMNPDCLSVKVSGSRQELDWSEVSFRLKRGRILKTPKFQKIRPTAGCERFDADAVGEVVTLRHWRAGDRFQPIGMPVAVKLQDLFVSAKIPAATRRALIVAEAPGRGIFWVEGLRISEAFKLQTASVRYLEWRWNRRDAFLAAATGAC